MQASSILAGIGTLPHNNKMQNFDQSEPQHEGVPLLCTSPWLHPLRASSFHWLRAVPQTPCMLTITVSAAGTLAQGLAKNQTCGGSLAYMQLFAKLPAFLKPSLQQSPYCLRVHGVSSILQD